MHKHAARITVDVFGPGELILELYTINGQRVATLMDRSVPAGTHVLTWDGKTSAGNLVASGVYLLRVKGPRLDVVEKIVVIK